MMYRTYKSGPVPVTYTDKELKALVDQIIVESNGEFSYKGICQRILYTAKENGKVEGAHHTEYSSSELSINLGYKVSRILWDKSGTKKSLSLLARTFTKPTIMVIQGS